MKVMISHLNLKEIWAPIETHLHWEIIRKLQRYSLLRCQKMMREMEIIKWKFPKRKTPLPMKMLWVNLILGSQNPSTLDFLTQMKKRKKSLKKLAIKIVNNCLLWKLKMILLSFTEITKTWSKYKMKNSSLMIRHLIRTTRKKHSLTL